MASRRYFDEHLKQDSLQLNTFIPFKFDKRYPAIQIINRVKQNEIKHHRYST
jgi:hypothetical protein